MGIDEQKKLATELSNKLWKMANDLRGNMDASEFKNYILGLLFYKFLSDKTERFMEDLLKEDGITYVEAWTDDEYRDDLIDESIDSLGYVLEPKYLFANVIRMIERGEFTIDYMEEVINSIIESTKGQESEPDFDGLFDDMDLKSSKLGRELKQRGKLIGIVLQTIDTIEFEVGGTDVDILGTAYISLIGLFAESAGKKGGEFYTPTNISKLVAQLATIGLKDVLAVSDPCCGSASMLLQLEQFASVRKYFGSELNSSTAALAKMNMILHDIPYRNFDIVNMDTLEQNPHEEELFTVQISNPPYSAKWSSSQHFLDDDRFAAYGKLAPKSKADFAFLQHMIAHMADGDSRIAVLLPHGVLFRGAAEETIRKYIIKDLNYLDAVIGLPANCFQTTGIPVAVLVLKKERNGNKDNICFIDASNDYESGKTMNYLTDKHIEKIVNAYTQRQDIDKYCHIASMDEIEENGFNLNIPRYVDTSEDIPEIDLTAVSENIAATDKQITEVTEDLRKSFDELGLKFPF